MRAWAKDGFARPNEKKTISRQTSKELNRVLIGNCQAGKTDSMIKIAEESMIETIPVIVLFDNSKDQLAQNGERIRSKLCGADCKVISTSDKKWKKTLYDTIIESEMFVMMGMANGSQLGKMAGIIKSAIDIQEESYKSICLIQDEADFQTKSSNVVTYNDNTPISQRETMKLIEYFNNVNVDVNRYHVSATIENILLLDYKIRVKDVFQLSTTKTYSGIDNIEFKQVENWNSAPSLFRKLSREINRKLIANDNTTILFVTKRETREHIDLLSEFSQLENCIPHVYNGSGITTFIPTGHKEFNKELKRISTLKKYKYTLEKQYANIDKMSIAEYYEVCRIFGLGFVPVTIGMSLMNRGISFVSTKIENVVPMVATTMFYNPGKTNPNTSSTQALGRLNGLARPELRRKVYATLKNINDYKNYIDNQKVYNKLFKNANGDELCNDIIERTPMGIKFNKPLDRKCVGIERKIVPRPVTPPVSDDEERDIMRQLVDRWWNKETIIGKILKFIYKSEDGVGENDLKNFIKECGSDNSGQIYIHLTRNTKEYKHVFERNNGQTNIKINAREYITRIN